MTRWLIILLSACIAFSAHAANYPPPVAKLMTKDITWEPGHGLTNIPAYWFPQSATIRSINCRVETPVGAAATFYLVKAPSGVPLAKGTPISSPCNGNAVGANNQNLLPAGAVAVNPGDTIGIFTAAPTTWAAGQGMGIATVGFTVP